ncbi:MAG: hypothetical protein KDD43_09150, partial [Bdellovibrionales bacterium]|nr:hypothetical protein [Bdellovibrionales bacterium]
HNSWNGYRQCPTLLWRENGANKGEYKMNEIMIQQMKGSLTRFLLGMATGGVLCFLLSLVINA